jgi:hypothetical protein
MSPAAFGPGRPGPTPRRFNIGDIRRFSRHCMPGEGECVVWAGRRDRDGYGVFSLGGKKERAHRIAWLFHRGPVPRGLVIDHKCRNRACQNVSHLEPVTAEINTRRSLACTSPTCQRGHRWTDDNTYRRPDGRRECRECRRNRDRDLRRRRRGGTDEASEKVTPWALAS